ncbi:MAG: PepSY domain-containing protein [Acidobacteria bacterium]|nr:PepSY domain-containing protein [Acidobacteriota bacterium]
MGPRSARVLYRLHKGLGLALGAFALTFAATGGLLLLRQELPRLPACPPRSLAEIAAAAEGSVQGILLPAEPGLPTTVYVLSGGQFSQVLVNPCTAARIGVKDGSGLIRQIHVRLMLPNPWGRAAAGLLGSFLLLSAVTGALVYGRFMRGNRGQAFRRGVRRQLTLSDLHKMVGIATLLFQVLLIATGATLALVPWLGLPRTSPPQTALAAPAPPVDLDRAWRTARQVPGFVPLSILIPDPTRGLVHVYGNTTQLLSTRLRSWVAVDRVTYKLTKRFDESDLKGLSRIVHLAYPLHYGDFGLRWAYLVFTVATLVLPLSGWAIAALKRRANGRDLPG